MELLKLAKEFARLTKISQDNSGVSTASLQTALKRLVNHNLVVDGIRGPSTNKSISDYAFQRGIDSYGKNLSMPNIERHIMESFRRLNTPEEKQNINQDTLMEDTKSLIKDTSDLAPETNAKMPEAHTAYRGDAK